MKPFPHYNKDCFFLLSSAFYVHFWTHNINVYIVAEIQLCHHEPTEKKGRLDWFNHENEKCAIFRKFPTHYRIAAFWHFFWALWLMSIVKNILRSGKRKMIVKNIKKKHWENPKMKIPIKIWTQRSWVLVFIFNIFWELRFKIQWLLDDVH